MRKLLAGLLLLPLLLAGAVAASAVSTKLETVFQAEGVVWSFAFITPKELLVTLRKGELLYVNLKQGTAKPLPTPPLVAAGQGGLLDVHFHTAGGVSYVYLTYSTEAEDELTTALARGIWNGQTIRQLAPIFTAKVVGDSGRHFGSRLLFHGGHIYMTVGDRGERDYAQDLSYHNGKILRLQLDGSAAAGNPFAGEEAALPEIWSYGHRNPQGIGYDSRSGRIYSAEFGPRGGDELNLMQRGANYGWPVISYGREYWGPKIGETRYPGMEQPVAYWTPSISPSGMAFYSGDKIPQWQGSLFLANLSAKHLRRLALADGAVAEQEVLFSDLRERIRHVRSGPDGYLYFSTDSGKIVRVLPQ